MAFDFTGKKILVTGAGSGIGRGIALALVNAGCKVYALGRNREPLDKMAAENSNIVPVIQDLANLDETKATLEQLETLDGLVNNAASVSLAPALDYTRGDLEKSMAINVYVPTICIQAVAKKMIEDNRKGSIVNISSVFSQGAFPGFFGYNVSKAGLDMVTKQFALELGPSNIRVNSVNPSGTKSEKFKLYVEKGFVRAEAYTERMPIARLLEVEDVVGPVLYLLSDFSSMVTGTLHTVDGGASCNITKKQ